jgi:Trypsin
MDRCCFLVMCLYGLTVGNACAQERTPNEVSRRLGVLAEYIEKQANAAASLSQFTENARQTEFRRMIDPQSVRESPALYQGVIKQLETNFNGELSFKNSSEFTFLKKETTGQLKAATNKASDFAKDLREKQKEIAYLSEQAALDQLRSITVPPEVAIAFDPERRWPAPKQGLAPLVIDPDTSGFTIDYPAVGALIFLNDDDLMRVGCTGTLIAPNIVVTAAHCTVILPRLRGVYFPHAGVFGFARPPIIADGFKIDLSELPSADVALLILKDPVSGIRPAKLNEVKKVADGTEGRVVGYGARKYYASAGGQFGLPLSDAAVLAATGLKIRARINTSKCPTEHSDRAICWSFQVKGPNYGTTCKGDSGGPLFVTVGGESVLYGITSASDNYQKCALGSEAFDVNISSYVPWIKEKMAEFAIPLKEHLEPLDPAVNPDHFFLSQTFDQLIGNRLVSEKRISVNDDYEVLRISVNTTQRGREITIAAGPEGQSPLALTCQPTYLGSVTFCETQKPARGNWKITLQGDIDKDFQTVVTGFKKRPSP